MALNPRSDAVIKPFALPYLSRTDLSPGLQQALSDVERVLDELVELTPQVAEAPPKNPRRGTQRLAVPPWDPLSTGAPAWVFYNGAAWVAL
jgi:hypothetical protein